EKTAVLEPRDVDEQLEVMLPGEVEQPARRRMIDAGDIRPQLTNQIEISAGSFWRGKMFLVLTGGKWSVSDSFDVNLLFAEAKELSVHADATIANFASHAISSIRPMG